MRAHRLLGRSSTTGFIISEAVLITSCYIAAAIVLLPMDPVVFLLRNGGLVRIALITLTVVLGFYLQDLYENLQVPSRVLLVQQVCFVIGLAFLVQALLNYIDSELVMPRWVMMTGSAVALVALPAWRIGYGTALSSAISAERVLFLGCNELARDIDRRLTDRPELGMVGIGFIGEGEDEEGGLAGERILGTLAEFRSIVAREHPDRIVVALRERRARMPLPDLLDLRFAGLQVEEAATAYEAVFDRVCVRALRPSQLIFTAELGPNPQTFLLQTVYSMVAAAAGLLLSLPLMLVLALLVKLTSRGPVLFRQQRVGLHEIPFTLYKFRSMYANAEAVTGAVWASKEDPRVTPVGRFLRRFRLDEIPQLFNVLKGEMSIVGPRPERPEFVETLVKRIPFYRQRFAVKPGITGWAQINHKYSDTLEDTITKLEYDLYYIKHMSPAIDAAIIFHTAKVILLGRGAQ